MSDAFSKKKLQSVFRLVISVAGLYFLGQLAAGIAYSLIAAPDAEESLTAGETLLISGVLYGTVLAGLYWLLHSKDQTWRAKARRLHVRTPKPATLGYSLLGFGTYFLSMLLVFAFLSATGIVDIDQAQEIGFSRDASGLDAVAAFLGLVVFASVAEELLFRGYLHQKLKALTNIHVSAVVTSFLFGLAHWQLNVAIDTFVLSLVTIYALEEHDNVLSAIAIHALKNGYAFLFIFVL